MEPARFLKFAGPIVIGAGLVLLAMDIVSLFVYNLIAILQIVLSSLQIVMGILLTIFVRMESPYTACKVWGILEAILVGVDLVEVILLLISVYYWPTFYIAALLWRK